MLPESIRKQNLEVVTKSLLNQGSSNTISCIECVTTAFLGGEDTPQVTLVSFAETGEFSVSQCSLQNPSEGQKIKRLSAYFSVYTLLF